MDIGIKIRATLKNDAMYKARIKLGYPSMVDFVDALNHFYNEKYSYGCICSIENLTHAPSVKIADQLSEFLKIPIGNLFPPATKSLVKSAKKLKKQIYFVRESENLIQNTTNEERIMIEDLRSGLNKAMEVLDDREKKVLELRFNNDLSLRKTGEILGIGGERVRQIECKALRKMRHPVTARILYPFVGRDEYVNKQNINNEDTQCQPVPVATNTLSQ